MSALNESLTGLADAIVRERTIPAYINAIYPHYTVETALEVYRNNYRGNLHETLSVAYPVIKQLVGDEFFRFMAMKYIAQHPSHSGNLHRYGAELSDFIVAFEPANELVYLEDIAILEWSCHMAYFASDDTTLNFMGLACIDADQYAAIELRLHPASQLMRSKFPIASIWQAHQPDAPGDFHIDLDSGPNNVLISRKADKVLVGELIDSEMDWLQHLQAEATLGEATLATLARYPEFDLQSTLLNLVARNALSGIKGRMNE